MSWFSRRATAERPVLVLDFETSGFSPKQGARVVWMGAAWVGPEGVTDTLSVAVEETDGLGVFGDAPTSVSRVTREALVDWLADAMTRTDAVVAHNAPFDERFARAEFDAVGRTLPATPWLDTVALARALRPEWPDHKLSTCAEQLGLSVDAAYEALADALTCAALFASLRQDTGGRMRDTTSLLDLAASPASSARDRDAEVEQGLSFELAFSLVENADGTVTVVPDPTPVCGRLYVTDITDPAHRAAHEVLEALDSDTPPDDRLAALDALTAADCPNAGTAWEQAAWYGDGASKVALAVAALERLRDHDLATRKRVQVVAEQVVSGAWWLSDRPQLMLGAWRRVGPWLAGYAPCEVCRSNRAPCPHLDFALATANAYEGLAPAWGPVVDDVGVEVFLDESAVAEKLSSGDARAAVAVMHELRESAPNAWALLVTATGRDREKARDLESARDLFAAAVATGQAPLVAYDRLSLVLERVGDYATAEQVARDGASRAAASKSVRETLTKRADRCAKKA